MIARAKLIPVLACIIFMVIGCAGKQKPKTQPDYILSREQMTEIICDLHIADAILTSGVIPDKNLYSDTVLYKAVFVKHNTTSKHFQESVLYYTQNDMVSFKMIYAAAVEKLNKQKAEMMGWK